MIGNDFTNSGYTGATDTTSPNYELWSVCVTDTAYSPAGPFTGEPVVDSFINELRLPAGTNTSAKIKDDGINSEGIQH